MGTDESSSPLRKQLAIELAATERYLAGIAIVISGVGVILALVIAAFVSRPVGWSVLAICAAMCIWYYAVRRLLDGGAGARVFSVVSPLVEISIPTAIIAMDVAFQTPQYASTMSVPLQLYGVVVTLQIVRLRRVMPIVTALVGSAQYVMMSFAFIRPRLPAELLSVPEFDVPLVFVRAGMILLAGLTASMVGYGLRGAVHRAARRVRAQELFGRYRILSQIADGGMGSVHRALYCPEGGFARPVALKRIHQHLARHDAFVAAFRAEAEISSRLVHANIVQVLDFGRVDDTYFLAMEYVDGVTLVHLLNGAVRSQSTLSESILSRIGIDILEGLHFAHDVARDAEGRLMRVLHRDLSPSNVLLGKNGEVRITDFGIARPLGNSGPLHTVHIVGKSAYMSPEQARGEAMDTRSDLFAAGIVLWECVTLRSLFWRGNTVASGVAVAQEEAPPPSAVRPVPSSWDAFFARALARDPAARFANAREMQTAWRKLMGEPARPEELAALVVRLASERREGVPPDQQTTVLTDDRAEAERTLIDERS